MENEFNAEAEMQAQGNTENKQDEHGTETQQTQGSILTDEINQANTQEGNELQNVPEEYGDFKLPEGVAIEPGMLSSFTEIAKEANLSQDQAQKLVDLATMHADQIQQNQIKNWMKVRQDWVNEIKSDPNFGGRHFEETAERARRVIREFGSPQLKKTLEETGLGDNPELIRLLARIGKAVGDDSAVEGRPSSHASKSAAGILYPNMK